MSRYFVILHSFPGDADHASEEFVRDLAAHLSRDPEEVRKLIAVLPAILVARAPTQRAQALSAVIESLGGSAEVMAEGSGTLEVYSSSASNPAMLKSGTMPVLGSASTQKSEPRQSAVKKDAEKPSFEKPGPTPPMTVRPSSPPKVPEAPEVPKEQKPRKEVTPLHQQAFSPTASAVASSSKFSNAILTDSSIDNRRELAKKSGTVHILDEELEPPSRSFARLLAWKAPSLEQGGDEGDDDSPANESRVQRIKRSFTSLTVFSAFAKPQAEPPKPKKPMTEMERRAAALRAAKAKAKAKKQSQTRNLVVYGSLLALVWGSMGFYYFSPESDVVSDKNQSEMLAEGSEPLSDKIEEKKLKLPREWRSEVFTSAGALRVAVGATGTAFDSGTFDFHMLTAVPQRPGKEGKAPRIALKAIHAKKLHAAGTPRTISGNAKAVVLNDGYQEQVDASVVITLDHDSSYEVISGTVEFFSSQRPNGATVEDRVEENGEGELQIFMRRTFIARFNPDATSSKNKKKEVESLPPL